MSTLTLGGSTLASKSGSVLSLNSGVTFPAGHIISFATGTLTRGSDVAIGASDYHFTDLSCDLVTTSTNNKIVVHIFIPDVWNLAGSGNGVHLGVRYNVGTGAVDNSASQQLGTRKFTSAYNAYLGTSVSILTAAALTLSANVPTVNTLRLYPILLGTGSGVELMDNSHATNDGGRNEATIIAYEVKQ